MNKNLQKLQYTRQYNALIEQIIIVAPVQIENDYCSDRGFPEM